MSLAHYLNMHKLLQQNILINILVCFPVLYSKKSLHSFASNLDKRGTSQSAAEYSLLLKKTSICYNKILTPPPLNLVLKKPCQS